MVERIEQHDSDALIMPGPITITDGGYCEQDSDERLVYVFDFDALNLPSGVELTSEGTLLITPNDASLTTDSLALIAGNRKVSLRVGPATTVGVRYSVRLRVTTNENPAQIKEKGFVLRIRS